MILCPAQFQQPGQLFQASMGTLNNQGSQSAQQTFCLRSFLAVKPQDFAIHVDFIKSLNLIYTNQPEVKVHEINLMQYILCFIMPCALKAVLIDVSLTEVSQLPELRLKSGVALGIYTSTD